MNDSAPRTTHLTRTARGRYLATNVRGGTVEVGTGEEDDFTPVELLLLAIAACGAADVDYITSKRAEPDRFDVHMSGDKVRDQSGNRMTNLELVFDVTFPDDDGGRAASGVLPQAVAQSHDRLCTVSRTVELGTPISVRMAE